MSGLAKICDKNFGNSNIIPIFAVRNRLHLLKSNENIFKPLIKAASWYTSLTGVTVSQKQKRSPIFFYNILQTNCLPMRNRDNLKSDAQGVSISSPNSAKTVTGYHPLLNLSKKSLIALLEGRANEAQARENYAEIVLSHVLEWFDNEARGYYAPESRDKRLINGIEAARVAFRKTNNRNFAS